MPIIDLKRIREALPKNAQVFLKKKETPSGNVPFLECVVRFPSLSEEEFEMCKQWQREIICKENISEFYTEETGNHWFVFLKRQSFEFTNLLDEDVKTFTGVDISGLSNTSKSAK